MVLLALVIRKIVKNAWLVSCLLTGMIISIALISSIPMYSEGILQRFLTKELEEYQVKEKRFTGQFDVYFSANDNDIREVVRQLVNNRDNVLGNKTVQEYLNKRLSAFNSIEAFASENVINTAGLPVLAHFTEYSLEPRKVLIDGIPEKSLSDQKFASLCSISDLQKHIELIDGRLPQKDSADGVYEVLVSEWALDKLKILKDQTIVLEDVSRYGFKPIKIKPVGVFTVKPGNDPFWYTSGDPELYLNENFIIDEEVFTRDFIKAEPTLVYSSRWSYALDYHAITVNKLKGLMAAKEYITRALIPLDKNTTVSISTPYISVIESYFQKSERLKKMLLVLYVPVIIMLFLYVFMLSRLIIDRERNEIALFASRGANRLQIVLGYLIEGVILGGIAYLSGPFLGVALGKLLGASNGFLEFARRKAINISFNSTVFLYAGAAAAVLLLTMLIPAFAASKTSIVNHKQNLGGKPARSFWEAAFLDVVFLLVSAYGCYNFIQREKTISITASSALDIQIDPLLFIVPALFITGTALLFLRVYPLFVKLVYISGKRFWPPSIYMTLIQVGRQFRSYHFLVVFMVMTLSTGIFSATAARTINRNEEEKVRYKTGADMVLVSRWENDAPKGDAAVSQPSGDNAEFIYRRINYIEPPFSGYTGLPGVESATKVFRNEKAQVEFNSKNSSNITMLGIEPYEFGNTAWFRSNLLQHHINEYLNLMIQEPSACLISRSLSEAMGIRPGDSILAGWRGGEMAAFTVYGIVDYWPAWNPHKDPRGTGKESPKLFVGNLNYIQNHLGTEPYDVWLRLKPGATSQQVYAGIEEGLLPVTGLTDAKQQLRDLKNDPFLLAINGVLTLGFIICGLICFLGFIIYWVLSINSRVLQFGILRAMGLSSRKLISMIVWEQLFTSGAAIFSGVFIGLVSSRIFVPFFQISFDAYSQVPPFRVISYSDDRIKIYLLVGIMLLLGLAVLGAMISRIRIDQAIKLGEE